MPNRPPVPTARTALVTWYTSWRSAGLSSSKNTRTRSSWYLLTRLPTKAAPTVTSDSRLIVKMYRALAPATSSTPIAIAISTEAEPRSGWTMSMHRRNADDEQPAEEPGVAHLRAALLGEVRAEGQQHGELGELGRLDLDRADGERPARVSPDAWDTTMTAPRAQQGET